MEREELAAWLRLTLSPGVGNTGARRLLAAFGLPLAIFEQATDALGQVVSASCASALAKEPPKLAPLVDATLAWLESADESGRRRILTLADEGYPPALLNTADPPLMLYVLGDAPLDWPRAIAVVGSRNPTP